MEPFGSANAYLLLLEAHIQISHANCCPFLIRVPPVTSTGGHPGSCPSLARVLPIMVWEDAWEDALFLSGFFQ